MPLNVRKARVEEAQAIIDLHQNTVRRINSKDYSPEQIDARRNGSKTIETDTTVTAEEFYRRRGYVILERKTIDLAQNQKLAVVSMKKDLQLPSNS